MSIDHRLSLRSRLLALVAVLGLLLVGVAIIAGVASASLSRSVDQRLTVIYPAAAKIAQVRSSAIDLETGERGYVLTGNRSFLEPYETGRPIVAAGLEELRSFAPSLPGIEEQIDMLAAHLDEWQTKAAEPEIALVDANNRFTSMTEVRKGTGKDLFDEVRADLDGLQQIVDHASDVNGDQSRADQRTLRNVLVAGLLAIVALIGALAVLLTRWVTRPTARLVGSVGVVASGDFREMIDVRGPPEFTAIANAVDSMRQRILSELDELERYNEALELSGPVVQRLRLELEAGTLTERPGITVDGRVLAAEGLLAGDFYDLLEMPDGQFAMLVADVSGHGHNAGVLALKVKYLLQAALQFGLGPSAALSWAAERLGDTGDMFVTSAVVVVDPAARWVEFASAGHTPGLLVVGDGSDPVVLSSTGPLIGPFPGQWRVERRPFDDLAVTIVLCSDGLLEARASADEQFGFDRFTELVRTSSSVDEIVEQSCAAARDHAGKRLADDLTVVALHIEGADSTASTDPTAPADSTATADSAADPASSSPATADSTSDSSSPATSDSVSD